MYFRWSTQFIAYPIEKDVFLSLLNVWVHGYIKIECTWQWKFRADRWHPIVKKLIASEELWQPCSWAQVIQQPPEYVKQTSYPLRVPCITSGRKIYFFNFLGNTVITSRQDREWTISRQFLKMIFQTTYHR